MNQRPSPARCSDCDSSLPRRTFLQAAGAAVAGLAAGGLVSSDAFTRMAHAAPTAKSAAESAVARFHASLSADQKQAICFPFEHPLRQRINANWHITKPLIKDSFYSNDQRALLDEIVKNVTTPEGYDLLKKQMEYDEGGMES